MELLVEKIDINLFSDFKSVDQLIDKIAFAYKTGRLTKEDLMILNRSFGEEFLDQTIQGHGLRKPYGYAGDFLIMDKIYTEYVTPNPKYSFWDKYFHQQSAPKAVRNRKDYFKTTMAQKLVGGSDLKLLNVACGPGRDMAELYKDLNPGHLITTCIDMDENAIDYARELNKENLDAITFINKNIIRFQTTDKYNIIWSAGLFDYFNDKAFILLLKRFKNWLEPGGEIIIGNFNENHNPSRNYMELLGEWYLNHRTEGQLIYLARQAAFSDDQISIGKEPDNVNLFLHIMPGTNNRA